MKNRFRQAAALLTATAALSAGLSSCSSNTKAASSTPSVASVNVDAALQKGGTITYWGWATGSQQQVAAFEKAYPNVKVNYVNAGTGNDQYTKLQNTIKAGSGAPDVAQVEYYALPQFELTKSLADLAPYGFNDLKSKFSASTWSSVTDGSSVYALPQDSGPMALFYNKAVFDKYGLTVPTTWDQYIAAAKKLHAANPKAYITTDNGDAGFATSMIWQAGGHPFTTDGDTVTINLQDAGTKKWADTWNQLVENKLVSKTQGWTQDWFRQLGNGEIATLPTGAWMPGNLEANAKAAKGDWRVAPMPTYDGNPVTAENGGSSQAVLAQSQNKALAAGFVRWLNSSEKSTTMFTNLGNFPSTTSDLTSSAFLSEKPAYFGGQQINTVLSTASQNVATGWNYLPFQVYANSIFADTVGLSYQSNSDLNVGLQKWQAQLTTYAQTQGFKLGAS